MLARLLLLFIALPFIELALLFWLADATDWKLTFGLVVLTGVVGALLAKSQGLLAWRRVRQVVAAGQPPTDALMDAAMILVAGALLLTPGLLTDAFGFSLLLPVGRRYYRAILREAFRRHFHVQAFRNGEPVHRSTEVIDVEVISAHDK